MGTGEGRVRMGTIYLVWDREGKMKEERNINNLTSFAFYPSAAALVLKRQILRNGFAARLSILYSPKGPVLDWTNEPLRNRVLNDLQSFAKRQGAIFLKMDPDVVLEREFRRAKSMSLIKLDRQYYPGQAQGMAIFIRSNSVQEYSPARLSHPKKRCWRV